MILATPPRPWADSAGQCGSAGSGEMRIGLLATLRDERQALPRFFGLLEALETDSRVSHLFCSFYENDSTDGTPDLLEAWLKGRPGVLQSERLGAPRLRGREISRSIRMAEARNHALAGFSNEPLDWLVVIDADLHAKPTHIWQLIHVLQHVRGVAMACASTLQNRPDIFGRSPWSYYMTATPCLINRIVLVSLELSSLSGIWRIGPSGWRGALCKCRPLSEELPYCLWLRLGPACGGMVQRDVSTGASVFKRVRPVKWWPVPRSRHWFCMTNLSRGARDIRCAASVN